MFDPRDDDGRDDSRDDREWRSRDDESRELGRGPGSGNRDPRDVFARHLNLPRGPDRQIIRCRDREYRLRGSESRTSRGGRRVSSGLQS